MRPASNENCMASARGSLNQTSQFITRVRKQGDGPISIQTLLLFHRSVRKMNPKSQPRRRFQKKRKKDVTMTITTQSAINSLRASTKSVRKNEKTEIGADNTHQQWVRVRLRKNTLTSSQSYCTASPQRPSRSFCRTALWKAGSSAAAIPYQSQLGNKGGGALIIDIC